MTPPKHPEGATGRRPEPGQRSRTGVLAVEVEVEGELEVEFNPQGTLAERLRAGGAGIPAFYTATGVGTVVAEGKPTAEFDGRSYVMERGIVADVALVHAWRGDTDGNLIYRMTSRNFNPLCAMAGKVTFAEVEELVAPGELDPDHIVTPGVFVQHVVQYSGAPKDIEQRTVRPRPPAASEDDDAAGASGDEAGNDAEGAAA